DVRKGRPEQARGQGNGRVLLRGDPDRPGAGRDGETLGLRQLPAPEEAPAARKEPQDRRGDSHHGPPGGDLPCKPEAEEPGGEVFQWPRRTWRRLNFRPSQPSAISP